MYLRKNNNSLTEVFIFMSSSKEPDTRLTVKKTTSADIGRPSSFRLTGRRVPLTTLMLKNWKRFTTGKPFRRRVTWADCRQQREIVRQGRSPLGVVLTTHFWLDDPLPLPPHVAPCPRRGGRSDLLDDEKERIIRGRRLKETKWIQIPYQRLDRVRIYRVNVSVCVFETVSSLCKQFHTFRF